MERALQLLVGVLLARLRLDLGDALGQARILRIEDERGVPLVEGLAQAVLAVRLLAPIVVLLRHLHAGLLQPIARLQVAWRELGDLLPALGRLDEASLTVERHALLETVLQHPALGGHRLRRALEVEARPVEDGGVLVARVDGEDLPGQLVGRLVLALTVEVEGVLVDVPEGLARHPRLLELDGVDVFLLVVLRGDRPQVQLRHVEEEALGVLDLDRLRARAARARGDEECGEQEASHQKPSPPEMRLFIMGASIMMNTVGKMKMKSGMSILVAAWAASFSALFKRRKRMSVA